ncbi:MAG: 50S ribosomal protein L18e [archaeon]|nr:MAG: 50S ribosomal protein L18e [archaeon]
MASKTKINKAAHKKNSELKELIFLLKKKPELLTLAKYLSLPRRKAITVNLDKINKHSKGGETVFVPGKVLGKGELNHKITLTSFRVSESALNSLKKSGSVFKPIHEFVKSSKQFKLIL